MSADEIARVENYAEELANEKITGKLYTLGVPYDNDDVRTTPLRQVITAAADGANALSSAEKYIMEL